MKSLLYMFFKICRKIANLLSAFLIRVRIVYFYYISRARFRISSSIIVGKGFSLNSDITNTLIDIQCGVRIRDHFNITIGNNGNLSIGKNCFFNNSCSLNCLGLIKIGDNCQFGEQVSIYDHNHNYADRTKLVSEQGFDISQVIIGNNCWIGSHVVILKGVEIGDNVVIGAGCVIYKTIDSGAVVYNQQNLTTKIQSLNE